MTQATEVETMELSIVSCETCDQLFLLSPRRQTCPGCGGSAGLTFFEFVGDASGLHLKNGVDPAPPSAAPVDQRDPAGIPHDDVANGDSDGPAVSTSGQPDTLAFAVDVGLFLRGEDITEDKLAGELLDLGADPESATTAVGRLTAVRNLVRELVDAALPVAVKVEAEPEPEPAAAEPPPPDTAPDSP